MITARPIEGSEKAAPLLFFVTERPGVVEFRGLGLIEGVELVSQIDPTSGEAFSNYAYDCCLVDLAAEGETLDWGWVSRRKDPRVTNTEAIAASPQAWRNWVDAGVDALGRVRRVVARQARVRREEQQPKRGSEEEKVLEQVYAFYSSDGNRRKVRFEALAELVAEFVIRESHGRYQCGWITRGAGDQGVDFVGRLDIGSGFSRTSLVVLGQAKCEQRQGLQVAGTSLAPSPVYGEAGLGASLLRGASAIRPSERS